MAAKKKTPVKKKQNLAAKPKVPAKKDIAANTSVKVATSNLFVANEVRDKTDYIADAILEDIGGQEIINLTRTDVLNGQNITYSIIANLASTQEKFNPNTMIALQGTDADYFSSFPFFLADFVPEVGTAETIDGVLTGDTAYVDPKSGDVVVNTINVVNGLRVEVQFIKYSSSIDGTIYT